MAKNATPLLWSSRPTSTANMAPFTCLPATMQCTVQPATQASIYIIHMYNHLLYSRVLQCQYTEVCLVSILHVSQAADCMSLHTSEHVPVVHVCQFAIAHYTDHSTASTHASRQLELSHHVCAHDSWYQGLLNYRCTDNQPIIGIGRLVHWYWPTVIYTVGKYKFFIFITKSKQTWVSGFRLW